MQGHAPTVATRASGGGSRGSVRGVSREPLKAKKECCNDDPRCKRCPVVCRRLAAAGYLERVAKRRYAVRTRPPKKVLRAARAR